MLVVQAGGAPLAALGELLATEAWRRGLGGIVVDGYVRDRAGLPPDLPLWARGTVPMAGRSDVAPRVGGAVNCGGVRVTPGDIVCADDDGIVIAPLEQLQACVERAEQIERTEAKVLGEVRVGGDPDRMTNLGRARRGTAPWRAELAGDHAAELNSNSTSPSANDSASPSKVMRRTPAGPSVCSSSGPGSTGSLDQSWPPVPTSTE